MGLTNFLPWWVAGLALPVALAVDRFWGEPPAKWHPVVWMGNYLGWAGRRVQRRQTPVQLFLFGAFAWIVGAAVVLIASMALQGMLVHMSVLATNPGTAPVVNIAFGAVAYGLFVALLLGLLLKPMLAWVMLKNEVLAVERALSTEHGGSLEKGRERLGWLVSRDVAHLTETQVRESAIESLAENLNDSVVAPIFWFVLLGLPGAALYRFANTADAMWGYRGVYQGHNWEWAGKWAARADDVLGWLPARITAFALALRAFGVSFHRELSALSVAQEARRTPSPNSGWPMAAMALALNVCLHKPGVYTLNAAGSAPQPQDTQRAVLYASHALVAIVAIAQVAIICIAIVGAL